MRRIFDRYFPALADDDRETVVDILDHICRTKIKYLELLQERIAQEKAPLLAPLHAEIEARAVRAVSNRWECGAMTAALFVFVIGALLLALAVDLLAETMAMKSSCGKIRAPQRGDGRRAMPRRESAPAKKVPVHGCQGRGVLHRDEHSRLASRIRAADHSRSQQ